MLNKTTLTPLIAPRDLSADTRARLDVLTEELASGRFADIGRALSSDFSTFSRISHALRTQDARQGALSRAGTWLDSVQTAMSSIQSIGSRVTEGLTSALVPGGSGQVDAIAATASGALTDIAVAIGYKLGGRAVFANGDPSGRPPVDIDALVAETIALATSATDVSELLQAFDDYFATGGGFETNVLSAYPADPTVFPLGGGMSLSIPVAAGDMSIRDALKQTALIASLPDAGFEIDDTARKTLSRELPVRASMVVSGLVSTQAELGGVQARVSRFLDTLGTERAKLEARKSEAVGADPFQTAAKVQAEMTRLETIYSVTARRANLRLTDYLR
ncbi:flagellin [Jannaschia helgolandensis]|uniref:Flagellin C-terminal helical region n=1 Tax=Jannaschia helgolandensis TaxID=188906 RepID=A0A1H7FNB6_9RHOB|nr:flagellin C-terminal helical region [Jannaschia helgolandensis]